MCCLCLQGRRLNPEDKLYVDVYITTFVVNCCFSKYSLVSDAGAVFWNILAVLMVVLWNTSVFCSPFYTDIRVSDCRHHSVWLDRYATYYLLSVRSIYENIHSDLVCKTCFIIVVFLSVLKFYELGFILFKQVSASLKFVCRCV